MSAPCPGQDPDVGRHLPGGGGKSFEVVADTRLSRDPTGATEFEDPSLNVFGEGFELVWRQAYPSLAEVGFETLRLPGRLMLHVSAVSVFRPVDQVLSEGELLPSAGDEMNDEVSFGDDLYDEAYIGPIRPDRFGIVQTYDPMPWKIGFRSLSPAIKGMLQRWQVIPNPALGRHRRDMGSPIRNGWTRGSRPRLSDRRRRSVRRSRCTGWSSAVPVRNSLSPFNIPCRAR